MNKKQEPLPQTDRRRLPWELPRFRNWIAVARVHQLWKKVFGEALAPLGIQLAHYDVLANIAHHPGLTQQALAEKLLVGRSAMSMLLPELERRGLIERRGDETDRRVRRLWLTEEGAGLTETAMALHVARLDAMMTVLSDAECDSIGEMMRRIAASLEGRTEPGASQT
ncbi:MarR family winged helix-turn-helix transcriptional regulator [Bosea sp. (in: a-proteobacteria)]|jgi:DNA-binding MarR family transcriptional regulator